MGPPTAIGVRHRSTGMQTTVGQMEDVQQEAPRQADPVAERACSRPLASRTYSVVAVLIAFLRQHAKRYALVRFIDIMNQQHEMSSGNRNM